MIASLSALFLLLGACDAAPGTAAPVTPPGDAGVVADADVDAIDCPADADTPTRLGCAEDAVTAALSGTPGEAEFTMFLTKLRDRHEVEALGPRLAQVDAAARLTRERRSAIAGRLVATRGAASPEGQPVLPAQLAADWSSARAASCPAAPVGDACRTGLDTALSRYLAAVAAPRPAATEGADAAQTATGAAMANAPMIDGAPVPDCASLDAGDAATIFERGYPPALVDPARVDGIVIAPAAMTRLIAYVSCAAQRTGYEPFVIDQARALFESRRHGGAALAALDAASDGTARDADAARALRDVLRPQLGRDGND